MTNRVARTYRLARLAAFALMASGIAGTSQAQDYPFRDITDVVVWGAGGGTDTINRMIMAEMEKHLPVSIAVTNTTGGVAGSNGMVYVLNQPADGYTLAGISESNVTAAVQGGWDKRFDVWYPFIIGGSPLLISVPEGSPYTTLQELVDAARTAPGTIPAAASGAGSIHHLNLLALQQGAQAEFRFIPYDGSAAGQEAAMAGEVDLVITSLAEQAPLIEGGKLRPLAMLTPDDATLGDATIASAFGMYDGLDAYLPLSQSIGFAVLDAAPDDVKATLTEAFDLAMASETVAEWASANHYTVSGASGEDAQEIFAKLESTFAYALQDLGATSADPATLGIEKP